MHAGSPFGRQCPNWLSLLTFPLLHLYATNYQMPLNFLTSSQNGSNSVFENTTIRQTFQVSLAAQKIRIRLSNAFGINDLSITKVTISIPETQGVGVNAMEEASLNSLLFNGTPDVVIPSGGLAVSDPIAFPVKAQSALMINVYLKNGQQGFSITGHPGSRTTSYLALGDWVDTQSITDTSLQSTDHW